MTGTARGPAIEAAFARRSGAHSAARAEAAARVAQRLRDGDIRRVRLAWCDLHGVTRCKTLMPQAALRALDEGIGLAGTLALKDTSDRTALPVFDAQAAAALPGFANGANLVLLPDPGTFAMLPWSPQTAWMLGDAFHADASACEADTRRVLARQARRLREAGWTLRCGLEVEFHVYRLAGDGGHLQPGDAAWPGPAPRVTLLHPGYRLLSEESADAAHEVLECVESTALGLGLPLASLEVEFGPSQFEAVFDAVDATRAADHMVLFRTALRQALARRGYLASFICRPPFASVMSSGWHLHQSVVDAAGRNAFSLPAGGPVGGPGGAGLAAPLGGPGGTGPAAPGAPGRTGLSPLGERWLAGLMAHAQGACLLGTPTANGYGRFRPGALAPTQVRWGQDDRAALLRVLADGGGPAARIENRLGEPAANPYLYIASQIASGLDGLERDASLADAEALHGGRPLPADLGQAIGAFEADAVLRAALGPTLCRALQAAKTQEWERRLRSGDPDEFDRREYFGRL